MYPPFIIVGAGGHGRVATDIVRALGGSVAGFVDNDPSRMGDVVVDNAHVEWIQTNFVESAHRGEVQHPVALAFGHNRSRLALFIQLIGHVSLPRLIHPTALISPSASIGDATHLCPFVVVHPNAQVGRAVILNTRCIIEHDCVIGDGCHVSPGAVLAGGVTLGDRTWVGANATIINNVTVGSDVTIGAGAVVIRDVPDGVTVVGNPARVLPLQPKA